MFSQIAKDNTRQPTFSGRVVAAVKLISKAVERKRRSEGPMSRPPQNVRLLGPRCCQNSWTIPSRDSCAGRAATSQRHFCFDIIQHDVRHTICTPCVTDFGENCKMEQIRIKNQYSDKELFTKQILVCSVIRTFAIKKIN